MLGLDEPQGGIKRNINNLRYAGGTKSLLLKVKEERKRLAYNSTVKKLRSWHPVLSLHGK